VVSSSTTKAKDQGRRGELRRKTQTGSEQKILEDSSSISRNIPASGGGEHQVIERRSSREGHNGPGGKKIEKLIVKTLERCDQNSRGGEKGSNKGGGAR